MNERRRYNCRMPPLHQRCSIICNSILSIALLGRIDDNTILFIGFQKNYFEMGTCGVDIMVGIDKDIDIGGNVTQVDN